jgi:hypothetical protein
MDKLRVSPARAEKPENRVFYTISLFGRYRARLFVPLRIAIAHGVGGDPDAAKFGANVFADGDIRSVVDDLGAKTAVGAVAAAGGRHDSSGQMSGQILNLPPQFSHQGVFSSLS